MLFNSRINGLSKHEMEQIEKRRNVAQGLEVLWGGGEKDEIHYDIVVVPGLGSDPNTCSEWPAPKSALAKESDKSQNASKFDWLRDEGGLHKLQPNARIMLYNYTSAWKGTFKVRNSLLHLSTALLIGLGERRKTVSARKRPLIFIGHCMGGLLIAQALCLADAEPMEYPNIVPYVTDCAFFGTPFHGTGLAQLAIACDHTRAYFEDDESYSELLKFMTPESDGLRTLRLTFEQLAGRIKPEIKLFCFYESWPIDWIDMLERETKIYVPTWAKDPVNKLLKIKKAYMVTKESAMLLDPTYLATNSHHNNYIQDLPLDSHHNDLIRFKGVDNEQFSLVMEQLRKFADRAGSTVNLRNKLRGMDDFQVACVRASLESGLTMRMRLRDLEEDSKAKAKANTWLIEQTSFKEWHRQGEESRSCLWIDGPPGYGKTAASVNATRYIESTIADDRRTHDSSLNMTLWACFFCDAKPHCSTAEDLLKSIILQLIEQSPKLAAYAENFLDKDQGVQNRQSLVQPSDDRCSGDEYLIRHTQRKATMTVEQLWRCLMDALKDISVRAVFILVNNIHRLERNKSLKTLFGLIKSDVTHRQPVHYNAPPVQRGRWFFTSSSAGRQDIRDCMRHDQPDSNAVWIDLEAGEYKADIRMALTQHVRRRAHDLSVARGYDKGLAFEIEKIVDRKAQDQKWVDVIFLQLEALPENCSRLEIRDRLDAAAPRDLRKLIADAWQSLFNEMVAETRSKVKDVLKALVLLAENVTLEELAVLTGYGLQELKSFVDACTPLLVVEGVEQRITFVDDDIKSYLRSDWGTLLTSSVSDDCLEEVEKQIVMQHGYLTWNCFTYLETELSSDEISLADRRRTLEMALAHEVDLARGQQPLYRSRTTLEAGGANQLGHANTVATSLAYPLKHWKYHAAAGGEHMAQSLCTNLSHFWTDDSSLRHKWLKAYTKLEKKVFGGLEIKEMTALHVTCALGLRCLSSSLLETDYRERMEKTDSNGYTPLHLAALNNHVDIVKLLLRHGADIEPSNSVASPLHLAAVRGHVDVMRVLLESQNKHVANYNATCIEYGPVINASIRSGSSDGIMVLLQCPYLNLRIERYEPPLVFAATLCTPELFQEILVAGKCAWDKEHYGKALIEASRQGRIECVEALISSGDYFTKDDLQESVIRAGITECWPVVTALLDRKNFGSDPPDYYNIFFLAAASSHPKAELLEHIWTCAKQSIPQAILDAALYQATDNEQKSIVQWLLGQCGASPNATSARPTELLHEDCFSQVRAEGYGDALTAAVFDDRLDIVDILLAHKAEIDSPCGAALQIAAKQGYLEMIDLLMRNGAKIDRILDIKVMRELNMHDRPGTALQVACDFNQPEAVKRLLHHGADPNLSYSMSKFTCPIISATQNKKPQILTYLLEVESTDVNVQGGPKKTFPLQSACEDMDLEYVKHLLDRGADINAMDSKGSQAIHMAAQFGNTKVLEFLLAKGANVTHRSQENGLALQVALKHKQLDCSSALVDAIAPILDALVTAAKGNNKFAESVIKNPSGQHPHIDTEKFERLLEENARLRERNKCVESTLDDYKAMEKRVEEHKAIADQKDKIAQDARAELEETHRLYDCSIEGYHAAINQRNSLRQQLEEARTARTREQEAERARLENDLTSARQQLQARNADFDEQQKGFTIELRILQQEVQNERLRADQLQARIWDLSRGNVGYRTNESMSSLTLGGSTTGASSPGRLSVTDTELQQSHRFSCDGKDSNQVRPPISRNLSVTDQVEPVTPIKRKKVPDPFMRKPSDINLAEQNRWNATIETTTSPIAYTMSSTRTRMEELAERAKARMLPKRTAVGSH